MIAGGSTCFIENVELRSETGAEEVPVFEREQTEQSTYCTVTVKAVVRVMLLEVAETFAV